MGRLAHPPGHALSVDVLPTRAPLSGDARGLSLSGGCIETWGGASALSTGRAGAYCRAGSCPPPVCAANGVDRRGLDGDGPTSVPASRRRPTRPLDEFGGRRVGMESVPARSAPGHDSPLPFPRTLRVALRGRCLGASKRWGSRAVGIQRHRTAPRLRLGRTAGIEGEDPHFMDPIPTQAPPFISHDASAKWGQETRRLLSAEPDGAATQARLCEGHARHSMAIGQIVDASVRCLECGGSSIGRGPHAAVRALGWALLA